MWHKTPATYVRLEFGKLQPSTIKIDNLLASRLLRVHIGIWTCDHRGRVCFLSLVSFIHAWKKHLKGRLATNLTEPTLPYEIRLAPTPRDFMLVL